MKTSTPQITNGINQSNASSCLARSKPLSESLAPAQLTCTQGRKKQTSTIIAALRLIRLNILSRYYPVKTCAVLLGERAAGKTHNHGGLNESIAFSCVHNRDRSVRKPP